MALHREVSVHVHVCVTENTRVCRQNVHFLVFCIAFSVSQNENLTKNEGWQYLIEGSKIRMLTLCLWLYVCTQIDICIET